MPSTVRVFVTPFLFGCLPGSAVQRKHRVRAKLNLHLSRPADRQRHAAGQRFL